MQLKLHLIGDIAELEQGIGILTEKFEFSICPDGFPVEVRQIQGSEIKVVKSKTNALITYSLNIHFFRALGLFLESSQEKEEFEIMEEPQFDRNGLFLTSHKETP